MADFGKNELNNLVEGAHHILITGLANPSADVLATAATWYLYLLKKNKQVDTVFDGQLAHHDFFPKNLEWGQKLEHLNRFKIILNTSKIKVQQLSYDVLGDALEIDIVSDGGTFSAEDVETEQGDYKYDLVLILGAPSLETLGNIFSEHRHFFHDIPIINIDRSVLNENYGQLNLVDTKATSLAEISYDFLKEDLDEDMATNILAGMIAATNSFQSPQVTPASLELASQLIVKGARRGEVIEALYRTKDIATLKNWGRVLSRLIRREHLISSHLQHEELTDLPQDFQDLVRDLILATPGAQVAVIFYQLTLDQTEAWVYGIHNIDVLDLTKEFNPNGHRHFAKIILDKSLTDAQELLSEKISEKLAIINSP